jgi:hypothetical protein
MNALNLTFIHLFIGLSLATKMMFSAASKFSAGVAKVDATPPTGVPLVRSIVDLGRCFKQNRLDIITVQDVFLIGRCHY